MTKKKTVKKTIRKNNKPTEAVSKSCPSKISYKELVSRQNENFLGIK